MGLILGTLLGAVAGGAVGCVLEWDAVLKAYRGMPTLWHDCGPYLFIAVWMGAVIGFCSRFRRETFGGSFLAVAAGMAAGFFALSVHRLVFGRPFAVPAGFASYPLIFQLLLVLGGGIAAGMWRFGVDRLID
ncbi:MAG TPA: hypothetical protein DEB40_02625 [Elusimicrobia bacterium]|nr:hypothetical protein [Elusimicrobiota bacterium]HBT60625.1 hypothetical protein [Elusimicrobiota bacterium]